MKRYRTPERGSAFFILAMCVFSPHAMAAISPPTMVALSGVSAPAGGNYSSFGSNSYVLNEAGQVAFVASLTGGTSSQGVFAGTPSSLQAAALQGIAAPAGGNYSSFTSRLTLNGAGQVVFAANLAGGTSAVGIFAGAPGSLQAVALQGVVAPGGGTYSSTLISPVLNGAGQVAFIASLTNSTSGIGVFAGAPGSIQAASLGGTSAPSGGHYNSFGGPVLNGAGQAMFFATLTGGTSTQGLFAGMPGSLQTVALQGSVAPAGGNYSSFGNSNTLNGVGQVAFIASLTNGTSSQGIFAGLPGSLQAVALSGVAAPTGGNYSSFPGSPNSLELNGAGQLVFIASLTGGTATAGIFAGMPGSVQTVALQGNAAPVSGSYAAFNAPVLNGSGQVAFTADLTGAGITSANDTALFAGSPGALVQVVREGDVIDVDPGVGVDNRVVKAGGISFLTFSGGQDGQGLSFNDNGQLVYQLTFTDNSTGIFTSALTPVPEPASLGLLATGIVLLLVDKERGHGRRRQSK